MSEFFLKRPSREGLFFVRSFFGIRNNFVAYAGDRLLFSAPFFIPHFRFAVLAVLWFFRPGVFPALLCDRLPQKSGDAEFEKFVSRQGGERVEAHHAEVLPLPLRPFPGNISNAYHEPRFLIAQVR